MTSRRDWLVEQFARVLKLLDAVERRHMQWPQFRIALDELIRNVEQRAPSEPRDLLLGDLRRARDQAFWEYPTHVHQAMDKAEQHVIQG